MNRSKLPGVNAYVAFLTSGLAIYLVGYLLVVVPVEGYANGCCSWPKVPSYCIGGQLSASLFAPLVRLDQKVRPNRWTWSVDR